MKTSTEDNSQNIVMQLSPSLFWDVDPKTISIDDFPAFIVMRVLERGEINDWRIIRDYFGIPRIAEICKNIRTLDTISFAFISAISNTPKEDYRCYYTRQLTPTLWNSWKV